MPAELAKRWLVRQKGKLTSAFAKLEHSGRLQALIAPYSAAAAAASAPSRQSRSASVHALAREFAAGSSMALSTTRSV